MKKNILCPTRGSTKLIKNGFRKGKQCFKCKNCHRQFIFNPKKARITEEMKAQMLRYLLERNSIRSICRIFQVSLGWFYRFRLAHLKQLNEDSKLRITEEMQAETADFEIDELCSYIKNKKTKVWIWMVDHRQSKQIIAFEMGDRSVKTCQKLWRKLQEIGIRGRLHTDLWNAYPAVFPKTQDVPHDRRGETNHIERFNGTLRSRVSGLVRKTYSFAKSFHNLFLSIRFFITHYNQSLI